ncbi:hypothetical protein VTI74DRAFT_10358 [Chaetomium olivicolor]
MFPVKGLSISAEKLKVETEGPAAAAASAPKPSRKRKRHANAENVTAANLADLWEKVIEHKAPAGLGDKAQLKKDNKRQKTEGNVAGSCNAAQAGSKEQQRQPNSKAEKKQKKKKDRKKEKRDSLSASVESAAAEEEDGEEWRGIDDEEKAPETSKPVKQSAEKQKEKKKQKASESTQQATDKKTKTVSAPPAPPAPAAPKLTPLQASMREKLISARFRHLNETLYTRPSAEAFQLFQDSPEMFTEYHEGFRRQVDVWPENPVDCYISDIKARAKIRFPPRNRNIAPIPSQLPLPRAHDSKTCVIADLGCGDAKLSTTLQPLKSKLRLDIRSFDLQTGGSPLVTRADIANLPLADSSVDVAIFCLALMGTNWLSFIEEAYRVLRWKGELWVAEIKSRFAGPDAGKKKGAVVSHSVGNRKKSAAVGRPPGGKKAKTAQDAEDEAADLADLAVHVDGAEACKQQETDISAFVEALRKRGFLLNRDLGENAVDMSNKMFVRMHFVKAAPAVKGKCAMPEEEREKDKGMGRGPKGPGMVKKKFITGDEEEEGGNEAAVLKPCVYKIR